jgi:hypothetical protein
MVPNGRPPTTNLLLPTVHIVRSIPALIKALKSPTIGAGALATFDTHLASCMAAFPSSFQADSRESIDPRMLAPILYLMNARIILHRHNLSTSCGPDLRITAVEQCVRVALDTTRLLSRALSPSSHLFGQIATTMIATHIWRCTLFLLFAGQYDAALTCIHASKTIASFRAVNVACGRNLTFFVTTLIEKCRAGIHPPNRRSNTRDEELMAYVSGDLQASTENSWVWQGSETGMALNHSLNSTASIDPGTGRSAALAAGTSATALSDAEMGDWGGWDRVEYLVQMLMREDSAQAQFAPVDNNQNHHTEYRPGPGAGYSYHHRKYSASPISNHQPPPLPPPVSRPSDRISIASII